MLPSYDSPPASAHQTRVSHGPAVIAVRTRTGRPCARADHHPYLSRPPTCGGFECPMVRARTVRLGAVDRGPRCGMGGVGAAGVRIVGDLGTTWWCSTLTVWHDLVVFDVAVVGARRLLVRTDDSLRPEYRICRR
jgi:hypothetical protein